MNVIDYIKSFARNNGLVGRWVIIFCLGYIVQILVSIVSHLFENGSFYLLFNEFISLKTGGFTPLLRPWTLFTYIFANEVSPMGILTFIFNTILFWTLGGIFQQAVGEVRLKRFLWIGVPTMGLVMAILGTFIPGTIFTNISLTIFIVCALGTLLAEQPIQFWFFPLKMKWLAVIMLLLTLSTYHFSAMGISAILAAILGFAYIKILQAGTDVLEVAWNWFDSFDLGKKQKKYMPHIKVVFKEDVEKKAKEEVTQAEIDRILDKINESGFANLSQEDKDTLARFSGKRKQDV